EHCRRLARDRRCYQIENLSPTISIAAADLGAAKRKCHALARFTGEWSRATKRREIRDVSDSSEGVRRRNRKRCHVNLGRVVCIQTFGRGRDRIRKCSVGTEVQERSEHERRRISRRVVIGERRKA